MPLSLKTPRQAAGAFGAGCCDVGWREEMFRESDAPMTPEEIEKLPYRPCVGIMVLNAKGEVFVGQRMDRDYDAWQMPQGGVDKGEEPRDAALRELEEETGITRDLVSIEAQTAEWLPYDLPHDVAPKIWKGRYRGQEQMWFLLRFNGTDDQVNIQTEIPEFSSWRWLAPAEMLDGIVPFKREVYTRVVKEFSEYL
ncbi:putative (di)nucleoside polyphosphate hydrolase [Sulfitobacter undariae]|uniref:RNA pyrophosphohydrolase n=2 Tax=Sulfitobacter undariae TaxID=1563671 RepID=A0A7W6E0I1_9RHOB|nr:putative (di)nucleoside polyphosphate hydrolase [Sulfitobacter undariae]